MLRNVLRVARKELGGFFSSPVAYIFLGAFLLVTLFVVFWGETLFARNIADVRPLFDWMPLLLIFLVAALTMRLWSEERRMGTIEHLLTLPVRPTQVLLGKFLACLALLALALLLTLPLPLMVSYIGPLDWGPVWGGYLAALCLGAAYIAIGLFLSARSDNQIVSLISTVLVCGLFYLLGSNLLTGLFGNRGAELLRLCGSGSRFASITRGVIDLRDLYYYLSLVGVFLALTRYSLARLSWARTDRGGGHRRWALLTLLLIANLLAGNLWLQQVGQARVDLTEGHIYSISPATRHYLAQLQQPLLIRGYFSAKTHPLLAPLVPRLRDLIREYQIAGGGKVRAEFVDPQQNPQLEAEANQKYGIKPVPFQVASRYQSSVVNSYFYLLVKYGDQYQVLNFRDLIEVKQQGPGDIHVELRNPEYALTRSIKKVLYAFQGGGNVFASLPQPLTLTGYVSADSQLPPFLQTFKQKLTELVHELGPQAGDKLQLRLLDPQAGDGAVARQIEKDYGFRPMRAGLFDNHRFYFYLLLDDGGKQRVQVPLPADFSKAALKRSLLAAVKRFSTGYMKTVALAVPPPARPYGPPGKQFGALRRKLEADYQVRTIDLSQGVVPETADILVVAAPKALDDKGLFAIDQFLMKGGTVLVAASPYQIHLSRQGLSASRSPHNKLLDWLQHNGLTLEPKLVLDPRDQPFPIPVTRNVGGFNLQEMRLVPYPYFLDVRNNGLNSQMPVTRSLNQVLLNWASPIQVDTSKHPQLKSTWLLKSSPAAWTSDSLDLLPRIDRSGHSAFAPGSDTGEKLLAVALQGHFDSWFKGKESPLLAKAPTDKKAPAGKKAAKKPQASGVIDRSPESARLVLFSSADFLSDQTLQLAADTGGQQQLGALQLVENTLDWSLEDAGLLSIRSRGHYARTLMPLAHDDQLLCEYLVYGASLLGLALVFVGYRLRRRRVRRNYQQLLEGRI